MNCRFCGDRGFILKGEGAVSCKCVKEKARAKLIKDSRMPLSFLKCNLDNFSFKYYSKNCIDLETGISYYDIARLAFQAAGGFVSSFVKDPHTDGFAFTGQVGSGKTYLACVLPMPY